MIMERYGGKAMNDHGLTVMMPWMKSHDAMDDHG